MSEVKGRSRIQTNVLAAKYWSGIQKEKEKMRKEKEGGTVEDNEKEKMEETLKTKEEEKPKEKILSIRDVLKKDKQ